MASAIAHLPGPERNTGRMNLWRLEWLRLGRTPRALALAAVFVFFGLLEPCGPGHNGVARAVG